jgi:hypothetical protein
MMALVAESPPFSPNSPLEAGKPVAKELLRRKLRPQDQDRRLRRPLSELPPMPRSCYPTCYPCVLLFQLSRPTIVNNQLMLLATPAGLEPATCRLEGGCSIQLSYGADCNKPTLPHGALQCDQGTIRFGAKLSEYDKILGVTGFGSSIR